MASQEKINTDKKTVKMEDIKVKLSTLWVCVMFIMVFADILSFIRPGFLEEIGEQQITDGFLLIAAVFIVIPIAMIFLSRVLKNRANRWVNIIAAAITILWVIGGGSTYPHYIFFATIETVCMLLIVWYAWKLPKQEA